MDDQEQFDPTRAPAPKPMNAVCPYCGADPLTVQQTVFQLGSHIAALVICANKDCRKVIPIQIMGPIQPALERAGRLPSNIVMPGRG